jgi:hypothetical protein
MVYFYHSSVTQFVAEGNCRKRFAMAEGPIMKEKLCHRNLLINVSQIYRVFELSTAFCSLGVIVDIKPVKIKGAC